MFAVTSVARRRASNRTTALIVASCIRQVRTAGLSRPAEPVPGRNGSPKTDENRRGWALLLAWRRRRLARVRGRTEEIGSYARGACAVLVSTAVMCTACGSSHSSLSSSTQSGAAKLPLSGYLVRAHEETGMERTGPATTDLTPSQWTSDGVPDAAAENTRLAKEGFREVISVGTSDGVSWAMQLGSAPAAAREEAAELKEFAYGPQAPPNTTRFTIPGISSADGWVFPNADANVLFTEGRCLMLVGDDLTTSDNKLPVVAAAHAIWTRTHGRPGPCAT
jgi:hypothetical protein